MEKAGQEIVAVLAMVIGLATLAVILSNKSNTPNLLQNFFSGFGTLIKTAVSPVTG